MLTDTAENCILCLNKMNHKQIDAHQDIYNENGKAAIRDFVKDSVREIENL